MTRSWDLIYDLFISGYLMRISILIYVALNVSLIIAAYFGWHESHDRSHVLFVILSN